jgi:hypothetical protein
MEATVRRLFHETYRDAGFPPTEEIAVQRRESTGAGRFVDLDSMAEVNIEAGYLDLPGRFNRMSGVPNGRMLTVTVEGGKQRQLEFSVHCDSRWDAKERTRAII